MKVTGGHESRFPLNALADDGRMAAPERAGAAASQHSVPSVPSSPTQPSSLWLCAKFSQYYSSRALCRHQYTHHMHQLMAVLQVIQCITPPPGSLAIMAASQQTLLCTLAVATQEACRPCGRACVGGRRPASQQAAGGTWHTQRAKLCRAAAGHKCAAEGMALIWIWTQVCAHTHGTCRGTTRLTCSQVGLIVLQVGMGLGDKAPGTCFFRCFQYCLPVACTSNQSRGVWKAACSYCAVPT